MEETLTVHRLQLDGSLRLTLATKNPIESAFSVVDRICKRVKRWRRGDHRERWVGAGLWLAEQSFRRVKGYKQLPQLLAELAKGRPRRLRLRPGRRKLQPAESRSWSTEFRTSSFTPVVYGRRVFASHRGRPYCFGWDISR